MQVENITKGENNRRKKLLQEEELSLPISQQ
jgi:hypothetical protein